MSADSRLLVGFGWSGSNFKSGLVLPLWLALILPSYPHLIMVAVAPLTTQTPWVRLTTTSFGAIVFYASIKFVSTGSPSWNVPSAACGNFMFPVWMMVPQVAASLLLLRILFVPTADPSVHSGASISDLPFILFSRVARWSPITHSLSGI